MSSQFNEIQFLIAWHLASEVRGVCVLVANYGNSGIKLVLLIFRRKFNGNNKFPAVSHPETCRGALGDALNS